MSEKVLYDDWTLFSWLSCFVIYLLDSRANLLSQEMEI